MKTVRPLIMIIKNPSVSKMAGSEKITKIGFIKALITASTKPAIIITPRR
ncbi:MAG: hypothetical protein NVS1B10_04790 [Candidatus Saccharimonadales bacterium]